MKLKIGTEGQRVGLFLGVDMRPFTHRSQKIASPSTAKHTEIQYNYGTEIQSKGSRTVGSPSQAPQPGVGLSNVIIMCGCTRNSTEKLNHSYSSKL